ncbi:RNA polymerase II transcription factor B subunit 4 [Allomyces javanicus]|nr:RNA polymerase II transcription factor B subunit 4 [Allomyces javanicus]
MEKAAPVDNRREVDYIRPAMAAEEGLIKPRGSFKAGSTGTPSLRGGPSVTTVTSTAGSDADDVSLLIVVLDCAAGAWVPRHSNDHVIGELGAVLDQLCVFLNAFLALNHDNMLALIGAGATTSEFLYPQPAPPDQHLARSTAYQQFFQTNNTLMAGIKNLMDREAANMGDNIDTILHCNLASALSKALCYANRLTKSQPVRTHLLVVSASYDTPAHYVALMNTIFSAQKADIPIDVCKLYGDSVFLQQAAHLTGGVYLGLDDPMGLIQHLMFTFLPPPSVRKHLALPTATRVDFRAACFCHQQIVSEGFVCSVCLSVYCKWRPVCATCKTKFPFPNSIMGGGGVGLAADGGATGAMV